MQDAYTFDEAIEMFTNLHKNWLLQTMEGPVPYTEWLLHLLGEKSFNGNLADKIKNLPSGSNLCHGDFHPYNIIITSEKKAVIIDRDDSLQACSRHTMNPSAAAQTAAPRTNTGAKLPVKSYMYGNSIPANAMAKKLTIWALCTLSLYLPSP